MSILPAAAASAPSVEVEVRPSTRRRRTVSAHRENGRVVICLPARLSAAERAMWVQRMLDRLQAKERRLAPGDTQLADRAAELSGRYLDGAAVAASVRWSDVQQRRWGSCTSADATIRLSRRLAGMPGWVLDYVLVHELAHLLVASHGPAFWALVERYPHTARARGFLDGIAYAESDAEPVGGSPDASNPAR